jgi:pectate lyase
MYTDSSSSTKGGAGGATSIVSTLPQLSAAASAAGTRIIVVQGAISGAAKVAVTSDKTIVGKTGSCTSNISFATIP